MTRPCLLAPSLAVVLRPEMFPAYYNTGNKHHRHACMSGKCIHPNLYINVVCNCAQLTLGCGGLSHVCGPMSIKAGQQMWF